MKFFSTVLSLSALAGITLASPQRPAWPSANPTPTPSPSSVAPAHPSSVAPAPSSSTAWHSTSAPSSTYTHSTLSTTSTAPYGTVTCLTTDTANYLVNGFASLLTAYNNATANAILASDFTDTSDSINFLAGYPEGSITFPSKLAFEDGQGSEPAIGFTIYSLDAVTCKTIAFRWAATLYTGATPVKGINIIDASNLNGTDQGWQIETNYSEFNSGLWSQLAGGVCA